MTGNLGGPGNPFARQQAQLRKALVGMVKEGDVQDVAAALLLKAKTGDVAAAKALLSYVVGRPAEAVNPDTLDREEWQAFLDNTINPDDLDRIKCGMPALVPAHLARFVVPCRAEKFRNFVEQQLQAYDEKDQAAAKQRSAEKQRSAVSAQPAAEKAPRAPWKGRGSNGCEVRRPAVGAAAGSGDQRRAREATAGSGDRRRTRNPRRGRGRRPITNGENGRARAGQELTERERTSAMGKILKALGRSAQPGVRRNSPRHHR
jgi:hypothetical protein